MQTGIPCVMMRGGTSRGAYFSVHDLPGDERARDAVIVAAMGGPDALQIDGIGGGHPLTSKVALLNPSDRDGVDVDYLFVQISPSESTASTAQNCGNILAGVGPYAIAAGWVPVTGETTRVRVYMENTASICDLVVQTPDGAVTFDGDARIDGVPGTAAPVVCEFLDVAGSSCGALLPTGKPLDVVDGIEVTCIDNGMPVVVLRAADLSISGSETPEQLDALADPRRARGAGLPTIEQGVESGAWFCGPPEMITEKLMEVQERYPGLAEVNLGVTSMGMPLTATLEQLEWFGQEVLPKFKAQASVTAPAD